MEDGKFYWLKLKKDFFKRHDITIIESMPNGKDYILFYLKLLCESVDHEGNLRFSEQIPYNEEMLATITRTNIDIVRSAIKIFTELQMMDIMDDGTFYMNEVQKMIGSAVNNDNANRQRRFRERQKALQLEERYECVTKNNESKSKSKSKRQSKKENISSESDPKSEWFEQWWKLYPRKEGKGKCKSKFEKLCTNEEQFNAIMDALKKQIDVVYSHREKKYIPMPETWLNQARWLDEIQPDNYKPMSAEDEEFLNTFKQY